ncbi:MAG: hypothetical protein H8E27_05895 [Verrucomicrobia subdivision 3 bacterium]|nr:hypothetical protein [Limisphaerales bacterium]
MREQAARIMAEVRAYRECPATNGANSVSEGLCSPSNPGNRIVAGEIPWFTRMPEHPVNPIAKIAINIPDRIMRFVFSASIQPT